MFNKIEEKQIKGYLTINKRVIFEGAVYHITQRAPGREIIFLEDEDYLYFLGLLKETSFAFHLHLYSFVLMPNHVHLFLKITQKNLSYAMKNLFEKYAKYFNKKYHRKGHVFCGRYRASLCNDDGYFLAISIYIHLNPFRAGLCQSFKDYRWSSISLYIDEPKKTFVRYETVLAHLNSSPEKAQNQYLEILEKNAYLKGSSVAEPATMKKI